MNEHSREELLWVIGGIRAILLAKNGTDKFPNEFYEEAKRLIGFKNA